MDDWWLPITKELTPTVHQVSTQLHALILLVCTRYPGRGLPQMAGQSSHSKHLWSPSCWPRNRALVIQHGTGRQSSKYLHFVCVVFFWVLWCFVLFIWFNIRFCGLHSADSYSELTFQLEDVMWGRSVLKELPFWLFTYRMLMPRSRLICE